MTSRRLPAVTLLLLVCLFAAPLSADTTWHWPGDARVVAFADVHGAYGPLVEVLKAADVIDEQLAWSGGDTRLVSLGDLVDRGPRSREVLDLLMRLEQEAAAAGGAVIVLMGNHEAMNVSGELEYVSPEEFAAFADEETEAQRDAGYENWLAARERSGSRVARAEFDEQFPAGYFAHREAFSPDGKYGRWILARPVLAVVGDTAFVHAGATDRMGGLQPEALAAWLPRDLESYARARAALVDAGALDPQTDFQDSIAQAMPLQESDEEAVRVAAGTLVAASQSPVFAADGPLWYRGTAWCHPYTEVFRVARVLENFGARRLVIGHTPTPDGRVHSRMGGRVIMLDAGMLTDVYGGRPAALVIQGGDLRALYPGEAPAPVEPLPRRVGPRPAQLTDDQAEDFLAEARIVDAVDMTEGVTRPRLLTLERDGVQLKAVFKTESTEIPRGGGVMEKRAVENSDRWQYEVAAYRIDRLLGLDLVPVTVEREYEGRSGSLQLWVGETVSELDRQKKELVAEGWCPLSEQWSLMYAFDALLFNVDRSLQNIRYDPDSWMLYLVDHSRTFRLDRDRPADLRKVVTQLSPDFAERLRALDSDTLYETLENYVNRDQIRALLQRRDRILADWGPKDSDLTATQNKD